MNRPVTRLLVANRGEIARRIFRTCRRLGIETIAVYSDADTDTPFVREADVAVRIGGPAPAASYLRSDAIIDAARSTGADAIHPGYGFLAESADFAKRVVDAGCTWIGPTPETIATMGSKIEARRIMEEAGVPVLPGCVLHGGEDEAAMRDRAAEVGLPAMVKASAGGGGKGMRVVRDPNRVAAAVEAARREAQAAFGDGSLFLERYVDAPRHVEIQIVGDVKGRVAALFERDCSIQRRHQKVIEEAPSPVLDPQLREKMSEAAVTAARAISYTGAGTVEFLLTPHGDFFFLEVNTRLQVEHPVTELVTGIDLVELQITIAEGAPLPPEVIEPTLRGHAVEARLYAEDPERDFLPAIGVLERFSIPGDVRVDSGVQDGSVVGPHYDPMLAKVIAHAPTRAGALRQLADALQRAELHGLTTNRDFLVAVLRHPAFAAGEADTHFLDRHAPAALAAARFSAEDEALHAAAAALAAQARRREDATVGRGLPSGWRNVFSQLNEATFDGRHGRVRVGYRLDRDGALAILEINGRRLDGLRLDRCTGGQVELTVGGVRQRYRVRQSGDRAFVNSAFDQADLTIIPRFPPPERRAVEGALSSPMPGTVVRVLVEEGATVQRGDPLVIVEAMKMEHEVVAVSDGVVTELRVAQGVQVEAGALLAVVDAPEDGASLTSSTRT